MTRLLAVAALMVCLGSCSKPAECQDWLYRSRPAPVVPRYWEPYRATQPAPSQRYDVHVYHHDTRPLSFQYLERQQPTYFYWWSY